MSDINSVILKGNVVADATPSVTSTGKKVVNFRIATNEGYGEKKITDYHNVVAWDALADEANTRVTKGARVVVEGRGKSGSYESKKHPGEKVYTYDIVASKITYLSSDESDLPTSF